jgi:hypothetical protein
MLTCLLNNIPAYFNEPSKSFTNTAPLDQQSEFMALPNVPTFYLELCNANLNINASNKESWDLQNGMCSHGYRMAVPPKNTFSQQIPKYLQIHHYLAVTSFMLFQPNLNSSPV